MSDYIIYPILVFIVFLFKSLGIGLAIVILLYIFASKSVKDKYLNTKRIDRMREKTTNKIKPCIFYVVFKFNKFIMREL